MVLKFCYWYFQLAYWQVRFAHFTLTDYIGMTGKCQKTRWVLQICLRGLTINRDNLFDKFLQIADIYVLM